MQLLVLDALLLLRSLGWEEASPYSATAPAQSATQWALMLATGVAVAATFLAVRSPLPVRAVCPSLPVACSSCLRTLGPEHV